MTVPQIQQVYPFWDSPMFTQILIGLLGTFLVWIKAKQSENGKKIDTIQVQTNGVAKHAETIVSDLHGQVKQQTQALLDEKDKQIAAFAGRRVNPQTVILTNGGNGGNGEKGVANGSKVKP